MYVHSLKIVDIKAFELLDVQFDRPSALDRDPYAGINVFVGGNASGKSTVLKCLAMVLSGRDVASQQILSPEGWLRRGSRRGTVEVRMRWEPGVDAFRSGGAQPGAEGFQAGLVFDIDGARETPALKARDYRTPRQSRVKSAERGPWNPDARGWFLAAYGPLRRLTGSSTDALRYSLGRGKLASCVTLFREDAALSESEGWLKQHYARGLEAASRGASNGAFTDAVVRLLNDGLLPDGFVVSRLTVDDVFMSTPNGGELPLRDLSDGCRSVYALILDILHSMAEAYGEDDLIHCDPNGLVVVTKPGVILIDELEAHLHPAWQRTACEWLRTRFPRVQFFITTHSPLVVQAADPGGVFVLPLPHELGAGRSARRLPPHEQEKIVLGRAEKVLLGEAFGLSNTWGARADRLVHRWERLTAMRQGEQTLSDSDAAELAVLDQQMQLVFDDGSQGGHDA